MRRIVLAALGAAFLVSVGAPASPALAAPQPAERSVSVRPAARRADIPVNHVWQSLNNCGPASVVMILSSMDVSVSQEQARVPLRGTNVLRGMGTAGMEPYLSSQFGLHAFARNNGTNALMKTLITNGFAPMVTQWLNDETRISHWRVVRGYDDDAGVFYVSDPMRGAAVPLSYQWFGDNWMPFAYRYAVIYRPEDEDLLRAIVGDEWYDVPSRLNLLVRAREEASAYGTYEAWYTYGEAAYQAGRLEEAVAAFERGFALGSANGIYTVRNSYPTALRLLGRDEDARRVSSRLTNTTPTLLSPNPEEIKLIQSLIGGQPVLLFGNVPDAGDRTAVARPAASPLRAD